MATKWAELLTKYISQPKKSEGDGNVDVLSSQNVDRSKALEIATREAFTSTTQEDRSSNLKIPHFFRKVCNPYSIHMLSSVIIV